MAKFFIDDERDVSTIFFVKKYGGKWKLTILRLLEEEPLTFGKIKLFIPNISNKVLTKNLKQLIEYNLIKKKVLVKEKKTVYYVTKKAKDLFPIIKLIHSWVIENYPKKDWV